MTRPSTISTQEREHLGRIARVDEREHRPRHDVLAVERRRLVPVGRAASRVQKRDVVRVDEFLCRRVGKLSEVNRQHGSAKGMLERLPRSQVGGERERSDDLGRANRSSPRRRGCINLGLCRHARQPTPADLTLSSPDPQARGMCGLT